MVPVLGVAGAAVDYARVTRVRAELSAALDESLDVLQRAPAARAGDPSADLRAGMEARLGAGFATPWRIDSLTEEDGRLVATVSAEVSTTVARLIGIVHVPVTVSAEARSARG
jgi:Flp pilus assembly protein TadG